MSVPASDNGRLLQTRTRNPEAGGCPEESDATTNRRILNADLGRFLRRTWWELELEQYKVGTREGTFCVEYLLKM